MKTKARDLIYGWPQGPSSSRPWPDDCGHLIQSRFTPEIFIAQRKCLWCGGDGTVICVLCDMTIPCMFCGGSGAFTPERSLPAHRCRI